MLGGNSHTVGDPSSATATLRDDGDPPPATLRLGVHPSTFLTLQEGVSTGVFVYTPPHLFVPNTSFRYPLAIAGTATPGQDYVLVCGSSDAVSCHDLGGDNPAITVRFGDESYVNDALRVTSAGGAGGKTIVLGLTPQYRNPLSRKVAAGATSSSPPPISKTMRGSAGWLSRCWR